MGRVRLICWNEAEAAERAAVLQKGGHTVDARVFVVGTGTPVLRELSANPPEAIVIDLDRRPSHGLAWGVILRQRKGTRHVPLVMAGGDEAKLPNIRQRLPDAVYSGWPGILAAVKKALAAPPINPVVPDSPVTYPHSPLYRKLNIKAGMTILVMEPPREFYKALEHMPEGTEIIEEGKGDMTICFVRSYDDLAARIRSLARLTPLWIAWQKQSARVKSELTMPIIREIANTAGLVDYKVCQIDATWSAMAFGKRKKK